MMLPLFAKAAAAGVVAALAAGSATNMYQTHQLVSATSMNQLQKDGVCESVSSLLMNLDDEADMDDSILLSKLQAMKRPELLQLFLSSSPTSDETSAASIAGHWNGILLDNNSKLMMEVSNFISNRLFAPRLFGRPWNGKAIFVKDSVGMNRFRKDDTVVLSHAFTYTLNAPSSLDGQPCTARMNYWPHHFALSPYSTMKDEIRLLTPSVAIGMGWIGWSGGKWNASPFVLHKQQEPPQDDDGEKEGYVEGDGVTTNEQ